MKNVRVILADDHPLTLEGVKALVEPHVQSITTVTDGRALVKAALLLKPNLIILDVAMPLLNGIDATIQIRKELPAVKLIFLTMHTSPAYLEAALSAGASGYVLKTSAREELLVAIQSVLSGRIYVTPSLSREHLERFNNLALAAATLRLSMREREALQLIAEGRSAKEIADVLKISVKTVEFHRFNIKRKLSLRTTAELTRYAIEQGLIQ